MEMEGLVAGSTGADWSFKPRPRPYAFAAAAALTNGAGVSSCSNSRKRGWLGFVDALLEARGRLCSEVESSNKKIRKMARRGKRSEGPTGQIGAEVSPAVGSIVVIYHWTL